MHYEQLFSSEDCLRYLLPNSLNELMVPMGPFLFPLSPSVLYQALQSLRFIPDSGLPPSIELMLHHRQCSTSFYKDWCPSPTVLCQSPQNFRSIPDTALPASTDIRVHFKHCSTSLYRANSSTRTVLYQLSQSLSFITNCTLPASTQHMVQHR